QSQKRRSGRTSNAFGPSWEFRCEPAPDRAGHCDRSRRHQPGGVRLDLLTLTAKLTAAQGRWAAAKGAPGILVISCGSALIGLKVLSIFNISLDVFRIVGGMIIAYMGFDMLRGGHTVGQTPPTDDDTAARNPLAPLIMFAAGPGTITAIVTLATVHTP